MSRLFNYTLVSAILLLVSFNLSAQNFGDFRQQQGTMKDVDNFLKDAEKAKAAAEMNRAPKKKKVKEVKEEEVFVAKNFMDLTEKRFSDYYENGVTEKLYLQTDKPYYSAGEDLWFKGYIVNAITHAPATLSNFIYVELIDQNDSIRTRVKIKADTCGFQNKIELPNTTPTGDYTLRAYTRWMQNWSEEYYFHRKINIINAIDDAVTMVPSYTKNSDGNIEVALQFSSSAVGSLANLDVDYTTESDGEKSTQKFKCDKDGKATIVLDKKINNDYIELLSMDSQFPFKKPLFVPIFEDELDVQFFPESGHLLDGQMQTLVFKAIGADGLHRDISGVVYDNNNNEVAQINSEFKGMGQFILMADKSKSYYAVVSSAKDSTEKYRFEIPQVSKSGVAIKAMGSPEQLIYQILATKDVDAKKVAVVLHSRGRILSSYEVDKFPITRRIVAGTLPEGISTIAVVDKENFALLAERLLFTPPTNNSSKLNIDKKTVSPRGEVRVSLDIKDNSGEVSTGQFALAVTDRTSVKQSLFDDNILSNLLLSSDIKGYVEEPSSYFTKDKRVDYRNRELLMLTQGWRRFAITDILQDSVAIPKLSAEEEHTITGEINGYFGNGAKKPSIVVYYPKVNYTEKFPLGDAHKFNISVDYPDSTQITLQGLNRTGSKTGITLKVDDQPAATQGNFFYQNKLLKAKYEAIPQSYVNQSLAKYYNDGGTKVYEMDGVTVVGKGDEEEDVLTSNLFAASSFTSEEMERNSHLSFLEAIVLLPNIRVGSGNEDTGNDGIYISGNDGHPRFLVDGFDTDYEIVKSLSMSTVKSIEVYTGADANMFGLGASNGVVVIEMKDGGDLFKNIEHHPSLAMVQQLGYKKPEAFYQPKYNVAEVFKSRKRDLRTTIYWNPEILVSGDGSAEVSFFTADTEGTYDIVLEGVAKDGSIIRCTGTVENK